MTTLVSLHIAYDNPRRIGITLVDSTTGEIVSNTYVKPPAFANYLDHAITRAKALAVARGLSFSVEHVAIWLAHLSREQVKQACDRVDQRRFDEGYAPDWQQPAVEIC